MSRPLPRVLVLTGVVAIAPVALVWTLRATGVIGSPWLGAALGAALSLAAYQLAAEWWQRRSDTTDLLFGEMMLWGWLRRRRQQRRIENAGALLDGLRAGAQSPAARAQQLRRLVDALEARDPYTLGHSRRVARYSVLTARRLGIGGAELTRIRTAAALHDIGKLNTPLEVLRKPGGLTDAEYALVKRHPGDGAELVKILEDPVLTEIVLRHHERLDGSGYPDRLGGDQVLLGAKIVAVADTFDAVTSARPYRAAKPHKPALEILRQEAGTKLDAEVVDAFIASYLGRRPLALWIVVSDAVDQALALIGAGSAARLAAAGLASLLAGAGPLVAPAAGTPATSAARAGLSHGATAAAITHHSSSVHAPGRTGNRGTPGPRTRGDHSVSRGAGARRTTLVSKAPGIRVTRHAGSAPIVTTPGASSPTSATTPAAGPSSPAASLGGSSGSSGSSSGGGSTQPAAGGGSAAGVSGHGSVGGSGAGVTVGAGVSANPSGATVNAGVGAGSTSLGATASTGPNGTSVSATAGTPGASVGVGASSGAAGTGAGVGASAGSGSVSAGAGVSSSGASAGASVGGTSAGASAGDGGVTVTTPAGKLNLP